MHQSLARIWLHVTFNTAGRRAYLQNEEIREGLFRMLSHHAKDIDCPLARSGGWIDHVHILCGLARTVSVAKLLEHLKTETSKWIKRRACDLPDFRWQAGYGAFSVSQSAVPQVIDYIERQAGHHRTMSFQEESRRICQRHEIEIDERYAWD